MRVMGIPPFLLAFATLAGCVADSPAPLGLEAAPSFSMTSSIQGGAPRPIVGGCELTFNPLPFPPPPVFNQVDVGTCQFSHLGRTQFYGEQVINLAARTQSGTRTFTAANGDELRATHVGTSAPAGPGLVAFTASMTFAGGTGRFANARGQATIHGTANLATRTTTMALDGWLAYDASNRSGR